MSTDPSTPRDVASKGPAKVGIICGLASEAATLADIAPDRIRVAGARASKARDAARDLIAQGVQGLISFGTCGGLAEGLSVGDLVLAERVVGAGRSFETHVPWRSLIETRLEAELGPVWGGSIVQSEIIVAVAGDKRDLNRETGAVAVDMESLAVAQAASEAGLPFVAIRAVSDEVITNLPPSALVGVSPTGEVSAFLVILKLLGRPQDLPGLIKLGRGSARAHRALSRASRLLGPDFHLR